MHLRRRKRYDRSRRPRHLRVPSQHTDLLRRVQRCHPLPGLELRQRRGQHSPYPVATNYILLRFVNIYICSLLSLYN